MNKLFTFILSLFLCSMASAQISVTLDGQDVASGTTFTKVYAQERVTEKVPGLPQFGVEAGLFPEIKITSTAGQDLVITLIDESKDGGINFCLGTCEIPAASNGYNVSKVHAAVANQPIDAEIHVKHGQAATDPYEVRFQLTVYGTNNGANYQSTIVLKYDPSAADSVKGISATSSDAVYTLGGQRVVAPVRKGIYVVGGRKVVK